MKAWDYISIDLAEKVSLEMSTRESGQGTFYIYVVDLIHTSHQPDGLTLE